jgi:hypothetical protein
MRTRTGGREWWVSASSAISVVALHALFITPLVLGSAARKRPVMPDMPGAGASALQSSAPLVEAMTLVDLSHTSRSDEPPLEELASLGIELPRSGLTIASPELTPPLFDEEAVEDRETTEAAGDTEGHAKMFGRYLGQISARIERAWRRPRSGIDASRFTCQTKIEQDERGKVLSVELRYCNGDSIWQRSLVTAIEHASPLPAPPIPSVFARMLVLDFSASAFQQGISDAHLYAPETRLAASEHASMVKIVGDPEKTLAGVSAHQGSIHLRIEGRTVTWTLEDSQSASRGPSTQAASAEVEADKSIGRPVE